MSVDWSRVPPGSRQTFLNYHRWPMIRWFMRVIYALESIDRSLQTIAGREGTTAKLNRSIRERTIAGSEDAL